VNFLFVPAEIAGNFVEGARTLIDISKIVQ
jgi:hypothetical protein